MFANSLRPHRHPSAAPHTRHHEWLTHFTPEERRRLILEDCEARMHMMSILVGIVLVGITMALSALTIAAFRGLL